MLTAGRKRSAPCRCYEIPDRVLDLGVPAVVGLEREHVTLAVGDERVVVVQGEERELGALASAGPGGR